MRKRGGGGAGGGKEEYKNTGIERILYVNLKKKYYILFEIYLEKKK